MTAPEQRTAASGLWRLLGHVRPYKTTIAGIVLLMALYSGANSLRIAAMGLVIDGVVTSGSKEDRGRASRFFEDELLPLLPGEIALPSEEVSTLHLTEVEILGIPENPESDGTILVREARLTHALMTGGGVLRSEGSPVTLRFRPTDPFTWESASSGESQSKLQKAQLAGPLVVSIISGTPGTGTMTLLWFCAGLIAAISLVVAFSGFYRAIMGQGVRIQVIIDIRQRLFGSLSRQSLDFFESRKHGDVVSRTVGDVSTLSSSIQLLFGEFLQSPLTVLFSLGLAFFASWELTLITIPFLLLLVFPVFRQARKVRRGAKGALSHAGETTEGLSQLLSGIRVIKTFGLEEQREKQFDQTAKSLQAAQVKTEVARAKGRSMVEGLYNLLSAGVVAGGGWFLLRGEVSISFGDFAIFMAAIISCYTPIKNLARMVTTLAESSAATDRIFDIIDAPVLLKDNVDAKSFPGLKSGIEFRDVCYRYAHQEEYAISAMNFSVSRGEKVALVGPSGAGKSTLFDLLARLREQEKGSILLDGEDSRGFTQSSILRQIAFVGQDPFLFNSTVEENIRGAELGASREQIIEAARSAAIHEDILALPEGYETSLGERGDRLSGGQRQRLTIARAFLRDAPILLLDEATAALDSESEQLVQVALERLMKDRTVLVIAHRLSTVQDADRVLVLQDGQIVEQGCDADLRKAGGLYSRLRDLQELDLAKKSR